MTQAVDKTEAGLSLTQATHFGRLMVKYGGIILVVLIVGRVFLRSLVAFYRALNPPPPPPPTVGFGRLPRINFGAHQPSTDKPRTYKLETTTGTTPQFADRAKVFLMLKSTPSLLADGRAREIAAKYNFVFEPEVISSDTYRWRKNQPLETQLELNIFSHHFKLKSNYLSRPDLLSQGQLPDDFEAVQRVKTFLKQTALLSADVATASAQITYLKSLGGELRPAVSYSDADYVQVELDRTPIDNLYQMYGSVGGRGTIHAIINGAFQGNESLVELEYNYQPIDYQQIETYPLRTSQQALKILQSGEGYVAQGGNQDTAVIRKVSLGYFESIEEQDYLQPIYVFAGDHDFLGYVPALDPQFVQIEK